MNKATSIYLDFLRFGAALVVFLGHASGQLFTGGLLWQLGGYLQSAVMIFFVMSGFVIAHVLTTRETSLADYSAARVARLYSIVIPALALTALCDGIGLKINPHFYLTGPWNYPTDAALPRFGATLALVNEFWVFPHSMTPGINAPFWSLSFEATYYLLAGLAFFTKGATRIMLVCVVVALSGPTICALGGVWLIGFLLYRLQPLPSTSSRWGWVVAAIGLALFMGAHLARREEITLALIHRDNLFADYLEAAAFAIHLAGVRMAGVSGFPRQWERFAPLARWLGSMTFALYLFHRPLIQLLAVLPVGSPDSVEQRLYILGVPLAIVMTFGFWCEKQKAPLQKQLLWLFSSIGTRAKAAQAPVTVPPAP